MIQRNIHLHHINENVQLALILNGGGVSAYECRETSNLKKPHTLTGTLLPGPVQGQVVGASVVISAIVGEEVGPE